VKLFGDANRGRCVHLFAMTLKIFG